MDGGLRRRMSSSGRTYEVRTYGCQMNVHDSERIAGLLDAAGHTPIGDEVMRTSSCSTPVRFARMPTTDFTAILDISSR